MSPVVQSSSPVQWSSPANRHCRIWGAFELKGVCSYKGLEGICTNWRRCIPAGLVSAFVLCIIGQSQPSCMTGMIFL